ncbi:ankyrin repeat-containing domain protein [Baffinella frigidus]|nr:ankyrin repeat-containing domain protein [Cryptophyta sp. CCMP2293]
MPASWTALWTSVALSRTDEVRLLLADGVEVSVKNNDGWTAMHYAALWGTEAMVDLLLDCGAEPAPASFRKHLPAEDRERQWKALPKEGPGGRDSIMRRVKKGGEAEVAMALGPAKEGPRDGWREGEVGRLEAWAALDKTGRDYANKRIPNVHDGVPRATTSVQVLPPPASWRADITDRDQTWRMLTAEQREYILDPDNSKARAESKRYGATPGGFMTAAGTASPALAGARAALEGREEMVRLLLESGAEASAKDTDGRTPEHVATARWHFRVASTLRAEETRRALAFAMGQHARLGAGSWVRELDAGVVQMVLDLV